MKFAKYVPGQCSPALLKLFSSKPLSKMKQIYKIKKCFTLCRKYFWSNETSTKPVVTAWNQMDPMEAHILFSTNYTWTINCICKEHIYKGKTFFVTANNGITNDSFKHQQWPRWNQRNTFQFIGWELCYAYTHVHASINWPQ